MIVPIMGDAALLPLGACQLSLSLSLSLSFFLSLLARATAKQPSPVDTLLNGNDLLAFHEQHSPLTADRP